MRVQLLDDTQLQLADGATGADAAGAIAISLGRSALAVKVDGELRDLSAPLPDGARLEIITPSSEEALELLRHDTAHVLAIAMMELYPGVKISIGPAIEDGFYYDFDFPDGVSISESDFARIEAQMREHVKADEAFVRSEATVEEALEYYRAEDQPYKVELIEDLVARAPPDDPLETVTFYTNGPFRDLCRGPHGPSTKRIREFKLQSVAGAYWRGDSNRTMLTRVYGTAFFTRDELELHLERLEAARARDHRRLGTELGLFRFSPIAPGSAFWTPEGTRIWNQLVALSREMNDRHGYEEVKTPQLFDSELWKTSGHWGKYRDNMFVTRADERDFALKPMNCPGHAHLFASRRRSYRELPIRYAEPGLLHRNEPSGALHGLLRVRHFAQDDAHIFCTEEQVQEEVIGCIDFTFETLEMFDFEIELELSTRPEQRIGTDEMWDRAEAALRQALETKGLEYRLNEGDGAFYGPKVDLHLKDSLGRPWQVGTVQLDYSMPDRFDLHYTGADDGEHRPVMIHRASFGSYERFIGILIEHLAGRFPLWLAPVQAIVMPIVDRNLPYAHETADALRAVGVRSEVDDRSELIARKVRDAELRKIPLMLVVGDRESESGTVSVREHGVEEASSVPVPELVRRVVEQIETRKL